jgi:hypothetical protein
VEDLNFICLVGLWGEGLNLAPIAIS